MSEAEHHQGGWGGAAHRGSEGRNGEGSRHVKAWLSMRGMEGEFRMRDSGPESGYSEVLEDKRDEADERVGESGDEVR